MIGTLRRRIDTLSAAAPRIYWYVWWGTLVNRLGGFVVPLLTIYLTEVRGLSVAEAGGTVSVFGAGSVAASIVGGQLSDRLGRRITMMISLFGGAAAMATLGFVRDLTAMTAMVGVVGFVGELYRPAVLAFVADVVPPAQRVHAYGLLHWIINVGFAVAAILGGLLAEIDFTILFLADAASMFAYGVIILVAVPETRPAAAPPSPDAGGAGGAAGGAAHAASARPRRIWFRDPTFLVFALLSCALALLPMQAGATLSAHMRSQDFSAAAYGLVMGVNGILIVLVQPTLTVWSASRDPSRMLALSALLFGFGFALHGFAPAVWMHAAAVTVWTLGEILESPSRSALVAAMAPAHARGRYQGAIVMAFGLSHMIGPKVGTWLWEHASPTFLWTSCLGVGLAVSLCHLLAIPARRRRLAEPPEL